MIVEYIRYRIPPGAQADFEAAYQSASTSLGKAPQCIDYELSRSVDEPECYVLRITWSSAQDHLTGFRRGPHFPPFFAAIKPYVDNIEEMRHYQQTGVTGTGGSVPTLYSWAGGSAAFERLTESFYGLVRRDELLSPLFAHMDDQHPRFVAMWLAEVFGGPSEYSEQRGGYPNMLAHHIGKHLTETQRRRWVSLLLDAADLVDLPSDPEFRAAFVGYIEWGTRLAVANSQPDAGVVPDAPVPRWGWGVAPPYLG